MRSSSGSRSRDEAEAFQRARAGRLAQCGVTLNAAKTRGLEFGRFAAARAGRRGRKPATFDCLGVTPIGGRSRRGAVQVRRKTSGKRLRRFVTATVGGCKVNRHVPLPAQGTILCGQRRGHYQDSGLPGNRHGLPAVSARGVRAWRHWLARRSQRARMAWPKFVALLRRYPLPRPVLRPAPARVVQGVLF